jgi:hypothetical protein
MTQNNTYKIIFFLIWLTPAGIRRFGDVVFNSHMFNATEVQLWKSCYNIKLLLFTRITNVWRSRTPDGVRCAHFPTVYSSVITSIRDQSTVVKTVEKTWVVYHVAEPYQALNRPRSAHVPAWFWPCPAKTSLFLYKFLYIIYYSWSFWFRFLNLSSPVL